MTGSGITLDAIVRRGAAAGWNQAVVPWAWIELVGGAGGVD